MLYGKGVKDTPEPISEKFYWKGGGKRRSRTLWNCPYYSKWSHMLKRCYCPKFQEEYPSYKGTTVCDEWLLFSLFRSWCKEEEIKGSFSVKDLQLDKDIIGNGKIYSPDNCTFVTNKVNSFIIDKVRTKSNDLPTGVTIDKRTGKYVVYCRSPFTGKTENLGYCSTPEEGHIIWMGKKLEHTLTFREKGVISDEVFQSLYKRFKLIS